ncbi:MAG: hypothetical protein V4610_06165 [Pseudomonadota bacterium]
MKGAPIDLGAAHWAARWGWTMRLAGLQRILSALAHEVEDHGDVTPVSADDVVLPGNVRHVGNVVG